MKKILIIVDTSRGAGRGFLRGIQDYIGSGAKWEISFPPPKYLNDRTFNLESWSYLQEPDGLIIFGYYRISKLLKLSAHKVVMHHALEDTNHTAILTADSVAVGQMAFAYFNSKGYKRFAYCSCVNLSWSQIRQKTFENEVLASGGQFFNYSFNLSSKDDIKQVRTELATWISSLPKPIALFVCNDDIASFVLEACKSNYIRVPDEVAVLGVDNDELVCRLSTPPLSSIQLEYECYGYKAARYLNDLIDGKKQKMDLKFSPIRVITRESTDSLVVEDKVLREALVYIRQHYHEKISVSDVADHVAISRSGLEKKFKTHLEKTIAEEISRMRIMLIKDKLLNLNLSINKIASSFEFTSPEHFSRFFKNLEGKTPKQFRDQRLSD